MRNFLWVIALLVPSIAHADAPDKTTPLASWTPSEQMHDSNEIFNGSLIGRLAAADMFGDKLSVLGRVELVDECFKYAKADGEAAMVWAVCGDDVKALDPAKAEAEKATPDEISRLKDVKAKAMEIGNAVEKNRDDKGIAAVLKLGGDAKAEWNAYAAKNAEQITLLRSLFDAVRTQKSNHKNFDGCWDKTYPAFSKAVKATTFPWDIGSGDYMIAYMGAILDNGLENAVAATTFAECAYAQHEGAEGLVASAFVRNAHHLHLGARTHAAAKLLEESFAPKFSDRSINYRNMQSTLGINRNEQVSVPGVNDVRMMMTPVQGQIGKVKVEGDIAKVVFKADKVESCLQWVSTNRVQSYDGNGNPLYEKTCKKRGLVDNDSGTVETPVKFQAGLKPGNKVLIVSNIPVTVWNGNKFVAIFGVAGDIKRK